MPVNITDVDAFPTATAPAGSDIRNAAGVLAHLQLLANRTRYLLNRLSVGAAGVNGFRLGLVSGSPLTDSAGGTTLYLTPFAHNQIAIYDSTLGFWVPRTTAEVSLSLSGIVSTGVNYDVFASWNGSAVVLSLTAWTNDTTRATALAYQDGALVKTGTPTDRYVGTIRGSAANTTVDSTSKRLVWNHANRVKRTLLYTQSGTWTIQTTTLVWRARAAGSTEYVEYVAGLLGAEVDIAVRCNAAAASAAANSWVASVGIGVDSSGTNDADFNIGHITNGTPSFRHVTATYRSINSIGYHKLWWVEGMRDASAGIITFGHPTVSGNAPIGVSGIRGTMEC
jgi:hypothetical protein